MYERVGYKQQCVILFHVVFFFLTRTPVLAEVKSVSSQRLARQVVLESSSTSAKDKINVFVVDSWNILRAVLFSD
ncbi:hypothetical protein JTE90_005650 [Oedothorax gibbosus]|uniref:Secreted protein n=1 Tax=Oedothorax gibbosus TaxID=931172 RepID=A0AAV6UG79_9ARAC|nr:hypothetical protein JTE90_005650 [Oedothorax gibbosus]